MVLSAQRFVVLLLNSLRLRCWRITGQILKVQCAALGTPLCESARFCAAQVQMLEGHILLLTPSMGPGLMMMMKKRLGCGVLCGCWTREKIGVIQHVHRPSGCG